MSSVDSLVTGLGTAVAVLIGVWRMFAHYEARNDTAHADLGRRIDTIHTRIDGLCAHVSGDGGWRDGHAAEHGMDRRTHRRADTNPEEAGAVSRYEVSPAKVSLRHYPPPVHR